MGSLIWQQSHTWRLTCIPKPTNVYQLSPFDFAFVWTSSSLSCRRSCESPSTLEHTIVLARNLFANFSIFACCRIRLLLYIVYHCASILRDDFFKTLSLISDELFHTKPFCSTNHPSNFITNSFCAVQVWDNYLKTFLISKLAFYIKSPEIYDTIIFKHAFWGFRPVNPAYKDSFVDTKSSLFAW